MRWRDALEDVARDRILVHLAGGDHVDRNALVLGHGAHVVRRHHAGVVGTVGEDDHHLAARHLGGVAQGQQQRVVERRIVARDALAQSGDGVAVIAGQRGGARQIAAEGVDRDRIGAVQAAHEIGDGVLRVHEALVHEVAGVEEHEDVGADEGVGPFHAGQRVLVGFQQRAGGAVLGHRQRRLGAFGEGGDLLQDAVFEDAEIGGLQAVDVVALVVGHLKAEHHHVDLDPEDGALCHPGRGPRRRPRSFQEILVAKSS